MITLYTAATPNGEKPAILLEELKLDYTIQKVDLKQGEQHHPSFTNINPNGKIPALLDARGAESITVFESGAILIHLAEVAQQFLAPTGQARANTLAWSFWQVGGLGPMIGQWGHFQNAEGNHSYAQARYFDESIRLLNVLEERLAAVDYLAGEHYSIADMMNFSWADGGLKFMRGANADEVPEYPAIANWISNISVRSAVEQARDKINSL